MYNHFQFKRVNEKEQIPKELSDTLYSIGTVQKMQSNTYIFREGMDAEDIFIIKSGLIKVSKQTSDGKKLTFSICICLIIIKNSKISYNLSTSTISNSE